MLRRRRNQRSQVEEGLNRVFHKLPWTRARVAIEGRKLTWIMMSLTITRRTLMTLPPLKMLDITGGGIWECIKPPTNYRWVGGKYVDRLIIPRVTLADVVNMVRILAGENTRCQ